MMNALIVACADACPQSRVCGNLDVSGGPAEPDLVEMPFAGVRMEAIESSYLQRVAADRDAVEE